MGVTRLLSFRDEWKNLSTLQWTETLRPCTGQTQADSGLEFPLTFVRLLIVKRPRFNMDYFSFLNDCVKIVTFKIVLFILLILLWFQLNLWASILRDFEKTHS